MKKTILSIFLSALSFSAIADKQWCKGTITNVYLTSNGELVIRGDWRHQHTTLCGLESEWKGVSTEACKGWLSLSMAAKVSNANVIVYYEDVNSCADIPAYGAAPSPGYVMLDK